MDIVFRLHGLPEVIISDHDPHFTSKFWESLFDLLGMDLQFSITYHPQTDGQSERMVEMLENFLTPYVERSPQTWSHQLALVEFVANNAVNVAMGHTPFFLQSSDHPIVPLVLMHGGGWFKPSRICASDGGSDEDGLGGSGDQSHRGAK